MRKIAKLFLCVLFSILFLLFPVESSAQVITSCQDLRITPNPGTRGALFTITANCNNLEAADINILISDSEGLDTNLGRRETVPSSGQLNTQLSTPTDFPLGVYYLILVDPSRNYPDNQLAEPLMFRIREDVSAPTQKACCSVRVTDEAFQSSISTLITSEPNCVVPVGEAGANACPSICQAVSVNRPDVNLCAGAFSGHRALCDNKGNIGIDSAIGCVPFENIDVTTQFLVRWSLGVGGGISLFLIALSGIKIATTKGDPKRLQDARDTFSAAIAGLLMIVLSVFAMRFISESLLNLF